MGWRFIRDVKPIARKPHWCSLCGLLIGFRERHVLRTGFGDAGFTSFRMHDECEKVAEEWDEEDWERPPDFPEFRRRFLGEPPPEITEEAEACAAEEWLRG